MPDQRPDQDGTETTSTREQARIRDWPHSELDNWLARAAGEPANPDGVPESDRGHGKKRR